MRTRFMRNVFIFGITLLCSNAAFAADLILRPQAQVEAQTICDRYGFTLVSALESQRLYLVQVPDPFTQSAIDQIVAADRDVQSLEFSARINAAPGPKEVWPAQSVAAILETYKKTLLDFHGDTV